MDNLLLLWIMLPFGLAEITCGHLKVDYMYHSKSKDCKIQLLPSPEMRPYITESKLYRWILIRDSKPRVILQKNAGTYNTTKYGEENYTLTVRNLNETDEGRYRVHCWTTNNVNYFSTEVSVTIPMDIPQTDFSEQTATDVGIGTTALIFISVCAVVIVAVFAGTIFLIYRRRKNGQEGVSPLVNEDNSSCNANHSRNEEFVYNEIDINQMTLDYAKVDDRAFRAHLHKTPTLPSRRQKSTDNDYDLINYESALDNGVLDTEHSRIDVKQSVNAIPLSSTEKPDSTYDSIKELDENVIGEIKEDISSHYEQETKCQKASESEVRDVKDVNIPEYAKVQKRKAVNDAAETRTACQEGKNEYKITFPEIDCSEITQSLGAGFSMPGTPDRNETVTYSNLVSRPQRVKSRQGRASRRSLQYAVLELAESKAESHESKPSAKEMLNRLPPCQYASIDFNQKAFVAPVRKAPSSWYKRRNKKGKKI